MVRNPETLRKFKNTFYKNEGPLAFSLSLKIFAAMWSQGIKLGVLPPKEPLEGIETFVSETMVLPTLNEATGIRVDFIFSYIRKWLKEFDKSYGINEFLKNFDEILKATS